MAEVPVGDFWREASAIAVLCLVLYAGHRGWWHWSPGVKALVAALERERDDWRMLAVAMLRKNGLELPEGFERTGSTVWPGEELKREKR